MRRLRVGIDPVNIQQTTLKKNLAALLPPSLVGAQPRVSGKPHPGNTLSLNTGAWAANGNTPVITQQWYANGVAIEGATATTYLVQAGDVGKTITAIVTATNTMGAETADSNGLVITSAIAPVALTLPSVVGNVIQSYGANATGGVWYDGGQAISSFSYQWLADGFEIAGATSISYTPTGDDVFKRLMIRVGATNSVGETVSQSMQTLPVAPAPTVPICYSQVTIAGPARVSSVVTVSIGEWNNEVVPIIFAYQWRADGVVLPGETLSTLVVASSHLGKVLTCYVTAYNYLGQTTIVSAPSAPVVLANQAAVIVPPIVITNPDGSLEVIGGEYVQKPGEPEVVPEYQWYDGDSNPIPGATSPIYTPEPGDGEVTVIVTLPGTNPTSVMPIPTTVDPGPEVPINRVLPTLSITSNRAGEAIITVNPGVWDARSRPLSFSYQWLYSNGNSVPDAAGNTYATVTPGDDWKFIYVRVRALNSEGDAFANSTGGIQFRPPVALPSNIQKPTISPDPKAELPVSAAVGTWNDGDFSGGSLTYTFQWEADGVEIVGATDVQFTPTENEVGKALTVVVTATNEAGTASAESHPTAKVLENYPPPINLERPVISGTVDIGETLTTTNGVWDDQGHAITSYTYQWARNGSIIDGADQSTYVITSADIGKTLKVSIIARSLGGVASVFSLPTTRVPDILPVIAVAPAISGFLVSGQVLTSTEGTWTVAGTAIRSFRYQWYRGTSPIVGAESAMYTLTPADIGSTINVAVTAVHDAGNVTEESAPTAVVEASFTPPVNTVVPVITGVAQEGNTLSSSTGTWTTNGQEITSYSYAWRRDGTPIAGATANEYTLVADDVGARITVVVSATNSVGSTSAVSEMTAIVTPMALAPTNLTLPTIGGTLTEGETLTASNGTWDDNNSAITSYEYQWEQDGTPLPGATNSTFVLTSAQVGAQMSVVVTAINGVGGTDAESLPTDVIESAFDADATTYFNAMEVAPDATRKTLINDLVVALKSAGVWSKLDILALHAAHDDQAGLVNVKEPSNVGTVVGTLTFTTDRGFTGNATDGAIDWGKSASAGLSQYSLNSALFGVWKLGTANNNYWIAFPGLPAVLFNNTGAFIYRSNSGSNNLSYTPASSAGMVGVNRTASGTANLYQNNASVHSGTLATVALPVGNVRTLANGTSGFSSVQVAASFVGSGLTLTEWQAFYSAMNTYMTAVGAV